jgi:hypothetical protein
LGNDFWGDLFYLGNRGHLRDVDDQARDHNHLLTKIVQIYIFCFSINPLQLCHDVWEYHIDEVVPHELSVAYQVLKLEFQQFTGGFLLVEEIKVLNLFQHLVLDDLAPNGLDEIVPLCTNHPELE